MLPILLGSFCFLSLTHADSIIISSDCLPNSLNATCYYALETLSGKPGADCVLFSTPYLSCHVDNTTETTIEMPVISSNHTVKVDKNVSIVTFVGDEKNGSTSLHGETIWNRVKYINKADSEVTHTGNNVTCKCKSREQPEKDEATAAEHKLPVGPSRERRDLIGEISKNGSRIYEEAMKQNDFHFRRRRSFKHSALDDDSSESVFFSLRGPRG